MKAGQRIFWRWKRQKGAGYSGYTEEVIKAVRGDLITFDDEFRFNRTWLDIKEMDIKTP